MRRGKFSKHNPIEPPEHNGYINLASHHVREALEAYDHWADKRRAPPRLRELMLVLSIEVEQLDSR